MRVSPALVALITFWEGVQAAPVANSGERHLRADRRIDSRPPIRRRTVPYSVVPVDGSNPTSTAPAVENPPQITTTIVDTIKETLEPATSIKTLLVTPPAVTVTAAPVTETVVSTALNKGQSRKHTKTVEETVYLTTTAIVHGAPATSIVTQTLMSMISKTAAPVTSTVTMDASTATASTSTKYYDNGMWHPPYPMKTITYPIRNATATTSTATSTTSKLSALY